MPDIRVIPTRKRTPKAFYSVGIYCRVSSYHVSQLKTLPSQVSGMISVVHQLPGHSIYNVYIDIASGSNTDRPAYQEMMEDARAHKIDKIPQPVRKSA